MLQKLMEQVEITLPKNGLQEKLQKAAEESRPLQIKLGFDPTSPDLHLGHAVVLKKLRQFQDIGHQIVIVVGSFTARIGDPTGKNKSRAPLAAEDVERNARTYIEQLSKILDVQKAKILFNSDWLNQLDFTEVIQILSRVTVAQLLHRNDFNKRFNANSPISMHELVYPILQGYDSVHISCDIEMGGTDQLFNCTMGKQFTPISLKSIAPETRTLQLLDLCCLLQQDKSKSAVRRLITSGAIAIDMEKYNDPMTVIAPIVGMKIRIGKKGYFEVAE